VGSTHPEFSPPASRKSASSARQLPFELERKKNGIIVEERNRKNKSQKGGNLKLKKQKKC